MRNFRRQFGPGMLHFVIWTSFLYLPLACSASTGIAFSNFGSGMSYNISGGNTIGNAYDNTGSTYAEADTFKSPVTGPLLSIQLALSCAFACPANFTISLDQNSSGQPGAVLESFTYAGTSLGSLGNTNLPVSLTSVTHPALSDGSIYWVVVEADAGDTDSIAWNWNTTGDPSPEDISSDNGATWSPSGLTPGAYQVNATIPEPGSVALLLGGAVLLGIICLRRRLSATW